MHVPEIGAHSPIVNMKLHFLSGNPTVSIIEDIAITGSSWAEGKPLPSRFMHSISKSAYYIKSNYSYNELLISYNNTYTYQMIKFLLPPKKSTRQKHPKLLQNYNQGQSLMSSGNFADVSV